MFKISLEETGIVRSGKCFELLPALVVITAITYTEGADPVPELTDVCINLAFVGGFRGYPPLGNFEI